MPDSCAFVFVHTKRYRPASSGLAESRACQDRNAPRRRSRTICSGFPRRCNRPDSSADADRSLPRYLRVPPGSTPQIHRRSNAPSHRIYEKSARCTPLRAISLDHPHCDRAISLAAACIEQTFRKFDVTGRLSGDEFVALIQEEPGGSAEAICQRLHSNLADCTGAENRYKLSLSVGVAHFDLDKPATLQDLMRQADTALYAQKRKRKNRACVSNDLTA